MHICNQIVSDLEFICWVIAEISSVFVSFIPCEQIQVLFFHSFVNYHEIYNFQLLRFLRTGQQRFFIHFYVASIMLRFFPFTFACIFHIKKTLKIELSTSLVCDQFRNDTYI